jgi:hypothetical protein
MKGRKEMQYDTDIRREKIKTFFTKKVTIKLAPEAIGKHEKLC